MQILKKYKKGIFILLIVLLIIYWFIGWTTIDEMNNYDYAKKIIFTSSMVRVHFKNNEFGSSNIISKNVLFTKKEWSDMSYIFSVVDVVDLDPCEVFIVLNKYRMTRHGFITGAFGADVVVISVKSSDGVISILMEGDYEDYANYADSVRDDGACL